MTHQLIISRLAEAGYTIFIPINGRDELILRFPCGKLKRVITQTASTNREHSPIARIPDGVFENDIHLAICDKATRSVWLIPPSLMESQKVLRLGKKYEDCILPEPIGLSWKEQKDLRLQREDDLKSKAFEAADKLFGEREE